MKSINNVQLVGYLGSDPQLVTMTDGKPMLRLRLATDTYVKQKDSSLKKFTDWHTVKLWIPEQVEKFRTYLVKGSHIWVQGRLLYRSFASNGKQFIVAEIRATSIVDLDR